MSTKAQSVQIFKLDECNTMEKDHLHKEGYYHIVYGYMYSVSLYEYFQWKKYDTEGQEVLFLRPDDSTGQKHYLRKDISNINSILEVDQDFSIATRVEVKVAEDDCILLVTLFNNGKRTFVIDNELGLSLAIYCFDKDNRMISSDGSKIIEDEEKIGITITPRPQENKLTPKEWESRLIHLEPGNGIIKKISLTNGWRNTDFSIGSNWKDEMVDYSCFLPKERLRDLDKILLCAKFLPPITQSLFEEMTGLSSSEFVFCEADPQFVLVKFEYCETPTVLPP